MKIYTPCGAVAGEVGPTASAQHHMATGEPLRIGVLDNGKPNARAVMVHLAEALAARTGARLALVTDKGPGANAATPCRDEVIERLRQDVDLVLVGSAD